MSILVDKSVTVTYDVTVIEVLQTEAFRLWLTALRDPVAKATVARRVRRLASGNLGDVKPVGGGVHELRIDQGPGYRVYFFNCGPTVVVVVGGGDKRTQAADIAAARRIKQEEE